MSLFAVFFWYITEAKNRNRNGTETSRKGNGKRNRHRTEKPKRTDGRKSERGYSGILSHLIVSRRVTTDTVSTLDRTRSHPLTMPIGLGECKVGLVGQSCSVPALRERALRS